MLQNISFFAKTSKRIFSGVFILCLLKKKGIKMKISPLNSYQAQSKKDMSFGCLECKEGQELFRRLTLRWGLDPQIADSYIRNTGTLENLFIGNGKKGLTNVTVPHAAVMQILGEAAERLLPSLTKK